MTGAEYWKGRRWWSLWESRNQKIKVNYALKVKQYFVANLEFKPRVSSPSAYSAPKLYLRAESELYQLREAPLALVVSFMQMRTQNFLQVNTYSISPACQAKFLLPFSPLPTS